MLKKSTVLSWARVRRGIRALRRPGFGWCASSLGERRFPVSRRRHTTQDRVLVAQRCVRSCLPILWTRLYAQSFRSILRRLTQASGGRIQSPVAGASAVRIVDDPPTRSSTSNPHTASPTIFEEAPRIGERLKAGQPVIMNLQNADRSTRRRLLDFASGACYALGGKMERVAEQVFLITPPEVVTRSVAEAFPDDEGFNV